MLDRISIPLSDGIAERHKARVTNHTSIFRHHHFGATLTMMMAAAAARWRYCAAPPHCYALGTFKNDVICNGQLSNIS